MKDNIKIVKAHYDVSPESEWERLSRHPFEFIFTSHMMDKYIKKASRCLTLGEGLAVTR